MAIVLFRIIFFLTLMNLSNAKLIATPKLAQGLYILGDSTVDGGNKEGLIDSYGCNMPFNPTPVPKRCTDGYNIADFIAIFLGLPLIPPYSNKSEAEISTVGVNYGYAGSGLLPETSANWTFEEQIQMFNATLRDNLTKLFSFEELPNHLSNSIFLLSFGINDYKSIYLSPISNSSLTKLTPTEFAHLLLNQLAAGLQKLYQLGAKRFLLNNVWPLGCAPGWAKGIGYDEDINEKVRPYSDGLPLMLQELQSNLPGSVFSNSNNFQFVVDMTKNAEKYGITNTRGTCCFQCQTCDKYMYFDIVHTTQASNQVFSLNCFNGTLCSPLNIIHLLGTPLS